MNMKDRLLTGFFFFGIAISTIFTIMFFTDQSTDTTGYILSFGMALFSMMCTYAFISIGFSLIKKKGETKHLFVGCLFVIAGITFVILSILASAGFFWNQKETKNLTSYKNSEQFKQFNDRKQRLNSNSKSDINEKNNISDDIKNLKADKKDLVDEIKKEYNNEINIISKDYDKRIEAARKKFYFGTKDIGVYDLTDKKNIKIKDLKTKMKNEILSKENEIKDELNILQSRLTSIDTKITESENKLENTENLISNTTNNNTIISGYESFYVATIGETGRKIAGWTYFILSILTEISIALLGLYLFTIKQVDVIKFFAINKVTTKTNNEIQVDFEKGVAAVEDILKEKQKGKPELAMEKKIDLRKKPVLNQKNQIERKVFEDYINYIYINKDNKVPSRRKAIEDTKLTQKQITSMNDELNSKDIIKLNGRAKADILITKEEALKRI